MFMVFAYHIEINKLDIFCLIINVDHNLINS